MFGMRERERLFADRHDAGKFLAGKLTQYEGRDDVVVLALPRGGVPVAFEIAQRLNAALDIFIVRKLGVPIYEELAMGAIASGGVRVLNDEVIRKLRITPEMIEAAAEEEERELHRRELEYRGDREPLELGGKIAILVDDGLATGASMRAAVRALKQHHPAKTIVAVPVGPPDTCREFESEVDEVVCGKKPLEFGAVGAWYLDFRQTSDEEVCELLDRVAHHQKVQELVAQHPERYSTFV
jgi:putative phosphoribosyl transferase